MEALQFNVAQLLRESHGAIRSHVIDDDISSLVDQVEVIRPLQGNIQFTRTREGILVTGHLKTTVSVPCRRCAEAYAASISMDLEETFVPTFDVTTGQRLALEDAPVDEATLIDDRHILDLSEIIRQYVILAMPPFPLCRTTCAGLCPQCGKNLNEGSCDCTPDEVNPQWSALQDLLDKTPG